MVRGPLEEFSGLDHPVELRLRHEGIVAAVRLVRAAGAGGGGHGERELGITAEDLGDHRGLAGPGRTGDHEGDPTALLHAPARGEEVLHPYCPPRRSP